VVKHCPYIAPAGALAWKIANTWACIAMSCATVAPSVSPSCQQVTITDPPAGTVIDANQAARAES
jgi:hypothetical protein